MRKMLMNRIAVRALELILCRLRAMLPAYLFMHPACLQEPSKIDLKAILCSAQAGDKYPLPVAMETPYAGGHLDAFHRAAAAGGGRRPPAAATYLPLDH